MGVMRFRGDRRKITVVYGPPGSGKSTYVSKRWAAGDLIVDVDLLFAAVSGLELYDKPEELLPFVIAARDAIVDRLKRESKAGSAWLITTRLNLIERWVSELGADVKRFEWNPEQCRSRLSGNIHRLRSLDAWEHREKTAAPGSFQAMTVRKWAQEQARRLEKLGKLREHNRCK